MMIRKICLILIGLMIISGSTSCSNVVSYSVVGSEEQIKETEELLATLIKYTNLAVIGEFEEYNQNNNYLQVLNEYNFKIDEVLYGNVFEKDITVTVGDFDMYGFNMSSETFEKGNKYLLFLIRRDRLYFDKPRYTLDEDIIIPIYDLDNAYYHHTPLYFSKESASDIKGYIKALHEISGHEPEDVIKVFRNVSLKEVVEQCDYIFKIKVLSVAFEGEVENSTTYNCLIESKLKGNEGYAVQENNSIMVKSKKGLLQCGNEYIVILSGRSDPRSLFYDIASDDGIIPVDDEDTILEIKDWIIERINPTD